MESLRNLFMKAGFVLVLLVSFVGNAEAFDFCEGDYDLLEPGCAYRVSDPSMVQETVHMGRPAFKYIKPGDVTIWHYHKGDVLAAPEVICRHILSKEEGRHTVKIEKIVETVDASKELGNGQTTERVEAAENTNSLDYENKRTFVAKILELVNDARMSNGCRPLALDDELLGCAKIRAEEISYHYSHTRPDGSNFDTVMSNSSRYYRGENIAAGYPTPQHVFDGWMESPGHRENILNPNYTYIGIGYYYKNNDENKYEHYWVQLFRG